MSVLASSLLLALLSQCPPPESISPCSCINKNGAEVSCNGITAANLKSTLTSLEDYKVNRMKLSKITFPTIADGLFKDSNIVELLLDKIEVDDASFESGKRHLIGLESSLETLDIRNSFRGKWPLSNLKLGYLSKLNVVVFEDNKIPEVGNEWFSEGPEHLNVLIFERNGVQKLGSNAFQSLRNLKLLAFAGNDLREVTRAMLPAKADHLATIDLAYNKLTELPSDIFSNLPSLQGVNLSFNLIKVLKQNIWSPIFSQLNRLHFEGNPLECEPDLRWVCGGNIAGVSARCVLPSSKQGLTLSQFCTSN